MEQVIIDTTDDTETFLMCFNISPQYAKTWLSYFYGSGKNAFPTVDGIIAYNDILQSVREGNKLPSPIKYRRI